MSTQDAGHGATTRTGAARDEAGAVLILALVFLVAVSLVVVALVGWAGNDLKNTGNFKSARSLEYATGGAAQVEIQSLRHSYTPTESTFACTPGGGASISIDSQAVTVYCAVVLTATSATTRVVTLDACPASQSQATCIASPYLQAVVTFDDYSTASVDSCTSASVETSCGTGMTLSSWVVE